MKKTFKVLVIIALLALIGFSVAGCKTDDDLNGTWVNESSKSGLTLNNNYFVKKYSSSSLIGTGSYIINGK